MLRARIDGSLAGSEREGDPSAPDAEPAFRPFTEFTADGRLTGQPRRSRFGPTPVPDPCALPADTPIAALPASPGGRSAISRSAEAISSTTNGGPRAGGYAQAALASPPSGDMRLAVAGALRTWHCRVRYSAARLPSRSGRWLSSMTRGAPLPCDSGGRLGTVIVHPLAAPPNRPQNRGGGAGRSRKVRASCPRCPPIQAVPCSSTKP
jgi:hypothetical protein